MTYTLKFFTACIWCSPLLFSNSYIIESPTYLRPTVTWPPRYHRTISDYHRESRLIIQNVSSQLIIQNVSSQLISRSVWTWFTMVIADSSMIAWWSGEGTIFIKSKMLLFPYTLIIWTQIFIILTFFTKL